jgi:hypothetical protein
MERMTKRPITQAEIDHLSARLDQIDGVLSDQERAVLRTVFDLAAAALSPAPHEDGTGGGSSWPVGTDREQPAAADQTDLAAGFEHAFQPGEPAVFAIAAIPPPADQEKQPTFKVRLV